MKELQQLHEALEMLDRELIALMEKREDISREIGAYQRAHALPLLDEAQEKQFFSSRAEMTRDEASQGWIRYFLQLLLRISRSGQRRKMNVYLVGLPGCKSEQVAAALGKSTGMNVIDLPQRVALKAGLSLRELARREGEAGFRLRLRQALAEAAYAGSSIVSTGEDILADAECLPLLRASGRMVFLDSPLKTLLQNADPAQSTVITSAADIERLYRLRPGEYRSHADITLDPDDTETLETLWDYCIE